MILKVLFTLNCLWATQAFHNSHFLIDVQRPSNNLYPVDSQICCNGVLFEKNENETCCGNTTYNIHTELCCFLRVYPKEEDKSCCGDQLYNTKTHACTSYIITAARGKDNFQAIHYKRGEYTVTENFDKSNVNITTCGKEIIYLNQSSCCGGKIFPGQDLYCCNGQVYDPDTDLCCRHRKIVKSNSDDNSCCGHKSYKYQTEVCIKKNDTVIERPGPNKIVCGDDIIDKNEKICCVEKLAIDNETKKFWAIAKREKRHLMCCGNSSYSRREKKFICCGTELLPREGKFKCCGQVVYDPEKDTCCNPFDFINGARKSKIYENKLGKCCGLDLYNVTTEYCCGVSVIPIAKNGFSGCCRWQLNVSEVASTEYISAYKPSISS